MMPNKFGSRMALLMLVGTSFGASAARAQAPAASSVDRQIADIVVTAQRREESLSKVPIAVTAITTTQLQTSGVGSTIDLPRVTPGLTTGASTQANAYFTPVLRGVGALTPSLGNDNSVALYVDGIYQSDKTASNIDLAAISQSEVLKGPQGTLYGRNATGGAINVTTRGPTDRTEVEGEASYGNFDKWSGRLFLGTPLTDTLGISIAYLHREGGDYMTCIDPACGTVGSKFGGTNVDAVQGKIVWRPGDFEAIASIIYYDRRYTDLNPLSPVAGTVPIGVQLGGTAGFEKYTYAGQHSFGGVRYFQPSLRLRYSLPDIDLVSLTGLVKATTDQALDYDGTSLDVFMFRNHVKVNDFSQEFQLLTTDGGPLQVTSGVYYYRGHPKNPFLYILQGVPLSVISDPTLSGAGAIPGGSATKIINDGIVHAKAIYAQATYEVAETLKITAGLRYSDEDRTYNYSVGGAGGEGTGLPPTLVTFFTVNRPKVTFKKLTWRFSIDKELSPDVLVYASYNRGFKSGVYNFSDFTAPGTPGGFPPAVKPEVLDAYEVGLKGKFLDRTLQVNIAGFYYDYRDLQVSRITATAAAAQQLENAGSEKIYGIDGDILFRVTPDLTLRANAAWLHARFGSYDNAGGFLVDANGVPYAANIDATYTRGLGAPRFSYDIGGDYTVHLGDSKLVLTGDYFHTSSFKTVVGDGNIVNSYGRLNAALTWYAPDERYYLRLFGQNLTDVNQIGVGTSPFRLGRAEIEPRTYGVAVGFKL